MDRTRELDADVANMNRQEFFERQDNGRDLAEETAGEDWNNCPFCGPDSPHEVETLDDKDLG